MPMLRPVSVRFRALLSAAAEVRAKIGDRTCAGEDVHVAKPRAIKQTAVFKV